LQGKKNIDFPEKLCPAIAAITAGFSFAFLQEVFIATLLQLARDRQPMRDETFEYEDKASVCGGCAASDGDLEEGDDLDEYVLWRVIKEQVRILQKQLESDDSGGDASGDTSHSEAQAQARW
jgi:transitional endoplasmic reticulum ATPase